MRSLIKFRFRQNYLNNFKGEIHYILSQHYDLIRENLRDFDTIAAISFFVRHILSFISNAKQQKREEEDRSMWKEIERANRKTTNSPVSALFCIAVSLYPVWADVDAIYQVLKQAGEIRGNSTNSPPTPPTAEHPPSGAAPSSARASSHPCSSSTSGKVHHNSRRPWNARRNLFPKFYHEWRITCA